jgi:hypothetical protein
LGWQAHQAIVTQVSLICERYRASDGAPGAGFRQREKTGHQANRRVDRRPQCGSRAGIVPVYHAVARSQGRRHIPDDENFEGLRANSKAVEYVGDLAKPETLLDAATKSCGQ